MEQYLPSVIAHTTPEIAEIWVADNGSTDGSVAMLKQNFPSIRILELHQNYGFAKGYALALSQIEADYYVVMNSDVSVSSNWLEILILFLESHPSYAAVMPKILDMKKPSHFEYAGAAGGYIDKLGYPFCRGRILDTTEADTLQYDTTTEVHWVTGACFVIRASDYHQVGGFDPEFWAHMEEIDLCWRLRAAGRKLAVVPQSVVFHLGGASLSYESPKKLYLNFRNNLYLLAKNLPHKSLFPILFMRLVLDGVAALYLLVQGKPAGIGAVLKAHYGFYRMLPYLMQSRSKQNAPCRNEAYASHAPFSILFQFYFRKKQSFSNLMNLNK
ncbi:MAG: hypothetical protein RIS47_1751 [Bacteroidota bacterium]